MARDKRLSLEQSAALSAARVLGPATALPIVLDDAELVRIVSVILRDTGREDLTPASARSQLASVTSYYDLPLEWFERGDAVNADLTELFLNCDKEVPDFVTYFKCLCELHKRRRKYAQILTAQPMPTMLQVSPRALLEFGIIATPALASWLTWRKWVFDIDNRAGQETGYMFEPILASALGGIPVGARNSPVKRTENPSKGRQVDCIVGRTAYEFKLRVTIAASGQGRFREELDFAADCKKSGFKPVLVVLDPTPSSRLDDLSAEFRRYGGEAYIGNDAWLHLEGEAGATMSTFVEKYVRRPIAEVDRYASELLDLSISWGEDAFTIELSNHHQTHAWKIARRENKALEDDGEEDS